MLKGINNMDTTFQKYQDLRQIAKHLATGIATPEKVEEATETLMQFAEAITAQDMTGYSTKGDIIDVKLEIKLAVAEMQATIYKVQAGALVIIIGVLGKMLGKW